MDSFNKVQLFWEGHKSLELSKQLEDNSNRFELQILAFSEKLNFSNRPVPTYQDSKKIFFIWYLFDYKHLKLKVTYEEVEMHFASQWEQNGMGSKHSI